MKVVRTRVYGFDESVAASKYPMSTDVSTVTSELTDTVEKLAKTPKGAGEDNFLLGIVVQFDLTFSNKAWVEMERYHFADIISSQSTMHRIERFGIDEQCNSYVDSRIKEIFKQIVEEYKANPTAENRLKILYNIPSGFELTARMTTNYRQLKTIYAQRKNHRLPEWRDFCNWIETLPHSDWITS